eukprot:1706923-Ditylum_brightwellii.AAC.1
MVGPVEETIAGDSLPLLIGSSNRLQIDKMQALLGNSIRMAEIGLLDPIGMAAHYHKASVVCSKVLLESFISKENLAYAAHKQC